ncbi:helix-turn-helix domain-containing protein [Caulobacter hibisci]|uniref:Helix-turn-helix domain-containing protein n=1 Tax=Caulobacter hibisci TaxID=2035993 RepID=A0ABS0SYA8_9CAUL|nr:helix-turn-helix domain-containing protein [Caulobacter hibisci]MBI1684226.1 helix-turn-helix domain-containing protein [Caulobacter hibisci]
MTEKHYKLDGYVLDTLMRDLVGHDHRPSAFLVYIALSALGEGAVPLSHAQLAERTGLSKRSVQAAALHLAERKLIRASRTSPTDVTRYEVLTPWR